MASRFPLENEKNDVPVGPVVLVMCENCSLVQLKYIIDQYEMYENNYGYKSGISNTMRDHLKKYNLQLQSIVSLNSYDWVLDIGSNDGTFLKYYDKCNKVGCDPTGKQFELLYSDINLISTYFNYNNIRSIFKFEKFKIITSIAMFYDLPDPIQFAKDVYKLLENNGIWSFEQSYALSMIEKNSLDTICHEHLEYYNIKNILDILKAADLKCIHISFNECNGGSMRFIVSKKESEHQEINLDLLLEKEKHLYKKETYIAWFNNCDKEISKTKEFIKLIKQLNDNIYIYGASTKGNTLLQYANLDSTIITFAVERNLDKLNRFTPGTNIPIISEEQMRQNPPKYMLVLPWHFKEEIVKREEKYLNNGGTLIFPFPKFTILTKKKRVLITGIQGQVGRYLVEILQNSNEYMIFGLAKNKTNDSFFSKCIIFDFNEDLENILEIVQPDIVFHLASITNSEECIKNKIETLEVNGLLICKIIDKLNFNTKIINASSCEIYKGNGTYEIKEDDLNYNPTHPYAYAKLLAHNMIKYYRESENRWTSNAILFTTESPFRKDTFLIKKCVNHIKNWKLGNKNILKLGNLNSYRNINHAYDIAHALILISEQENGEDYIVCSENYLSIKDIIVNLYKEAGIDITEDKNSFYSNNEVIIEFGLYNRTFEANLNGKSEKLKNIGWKPKFNMELLFKDLLNK